MTINLSTSIMEIRGVMPLTFISWTLLVCFVSAQATGCDRGWFGSLCQYKCQCTNSYCNTDGVCLRGATCQGGWFGPACQYADLAYYSQLRITDGDDKTCNLVNTDAVTVSLTNPNQFTWMRIHVSRSDYLHRMTFSFKYDSSLSCINQWNATVDDTTLDIHCDLPEMIQHVTLTGEGVRYLCSIYVSGGRNVALKQNTWQSKTYISYGSERSVDGNTNRNLIYGSCSVTQVSGSFIPWWSVKLSRPSHVNRYVLFTRDGYWYRFKGFTLQSSDALENSVFTYTQTTPYIELPVYTLTSLNVKSPVSIVIVQNSNFNILEMCEVELYGESDCKQGTYGRECDHTCNCAGGLPCFISTGGCPTGCAVGFYGESCDSPCKYGYYGQGCKDTCSEFCARNMSDERSCDHINGTCLRGCQSGYQGLTCISPCRSGYYGPRCSNSCSEFCVRNTSDDRSCDHVSGSCLHGCQIGYQKPTCIAPCDRGRYGQDCSLSCSTFCLDTNKTDDSVCHLITGDCTFGCYSGHQSSFCEKGSQDSQQMNNTEIVGATMGSIIILIVIVLVVIALVILRKRRHTKQAIKYIPGRELNKNSTSLNGSSAKLLEIAENRATDKNVNGTTQVEQGAEHVPDSVVYYNCLPQQSSTVVSLDELHDFMSTRDDKFFKNQFSAIAVNQTATMTEGLSSDNKHKNRYKNVCAYNHSRVHLIPNVDKKHGDYINASYIEGYQSDEKFIASQGPTKVILEDFVRMLWEQEVEKVVMLTNLVEEGKQKCERYWPEDDAMKVGEITVKLTTTQVFADYTIRRLQLIKEGMPSHHLVQCHFTSWPDKDVPNTPWSLVNFEQKVASYPTNKHIIVHCSAGVGRTGTFIALRNVMRKAEETGQMDFFTTVQKMRHDRINMIQTSEQYKFLHRAAQVAMLCIGTTVTSRDIANRILVLDSKTSSGQTKMEAEFKAVCSVCDEKEEDNLSENPDTVYENSQNVANRQKNRVKNILPKELYRARLRCDNSGIGDYINAVLVPSFSKQNKQILTQLPLPTTITDFWRLVTQYKVTLIVAFELHLNTIDQTIGDYLLSSENDTVTSSIFTIKTEPVITGKFWRQQSLAISIDEAMHKFSSDASEHSVTHLTVTSTDLDNETVLAITQKIRSHQCTDEGRTLYMCRNGADYSGLVYVLSLLLDRMDNDQRLTVPLSVGAIKSIRPQVIPTLDQYRLLYQVLKLYGESITEYSNFSSSQS